MDLRPAIFLDRDGVVIDDVHHLASPDQVRLIPGSADAIAALNRSGWPVVIVTNQSGVARGLFTADGVHDVHRHLSDQLAGYGAKIEAYYFCPHYPTAEVPAYRVDCSCRKPRPGMLQQAAKELGLDLSRSWMIGDRETDLQAGAAVGASTILVRTGYGAAANAAILDRTALNLQLVATNLADAVRKCGLA
ncbi:MAG TPA: D-glycero-beta-D-manno-heptose 1,7-bisphosphate 7-phosphatase, partial [Urbifossiella sp.]